MLARIEALEKANRGPPQPRTAPLPHASSAAPTTPLTAEQTEFIIDNTITNKILPQIDHQIRTATEVLHKMISDTTETLLRLTDTLTQRITALEQTNHTMFPPEPKKPRTSQTDDETPIDDC